MSLFLWSDPHIGHKRALELMPERAKVWDSVPEMSQGLIDNMNAVAGPDDTILILGDAVMGIRDESLLFFSQVDARLELIMGNHDKCHPSDPKSSEFVELYLKYFKTLLLQPRMEIGGRECVLCHFPYKGDSHEGRRHDYSKWYPVDDGSTISIHGHTHQKEIFTGPRQIHIGCDADWTAYGVERYHPIPINAVAQAINDLA